MEIAKMLDLLATTLAQTPANKYTNLLFERSYIFRSFLRSLKPKDMTGTSVKFNAIIQGDAGDSDTDATTTGFGVYDGAYDTIPFKQAEYMAQGETNWAQYIGQWVISRKELLLNSGKEGFIELGKAKLEGAMTRLANILETHFWSTSGYLHVADERPWILGPEYWVTDDGFAINDSAGTNGTLVGGISPTNAAYVDANSINRWRNGFKSISAPNELLDGMDYLFAQCHFVAPEDVNPNTTPSFKRFRIVFNMNGFLSWKKLMRLLGEPLDPTNPTFNNVKVELADQMAARTDSTNQGFFFNLDTWEARVAKGMNFSKDPMVTPTNQPGVRGQFFNLWPSIYCTDRRSNGKIFGFGNDVIAA